MTDQIRKKAASGAGGGGSNPLAPTSTIHQKSLNKQPSGLSPWRLFFGDPTENRTLAVTNGYALFLLNLGNELTQPELFTELAEILKILRVGNARGSLDSF